MLQPLASERALPLVAIAALLRRQQIPVAIWQLARASALKQGERLGCLCSRRLDWLRFPSTQALHFIRDVLVDGLNILSGK